MATNHYFNNYGSKYTEQRLVEDLVVESIKIMGTDCFYLPNDNDSARDLIYGEDPLKKFTSAYPIELYPSNVMEYKGDKDFFSKFGLEIKNHMTVVVSKRSFNQRVPVDPRYERPRDGDLIYIPPLNGVGELYEIKFVNQDMDMAMLGRRVPFFYELELEKFKYSHETIDTGIPDIDIVQQYEAYSQRFTLSSVNGKFEIGETIFVSPDNTLENSEASGIISAYNSVTANVDINTIVGTFTPGDLARGATSNATAILSSTNIYEHSEFHADYDNKQINTEVGSIIDFSETNPFGNI
ncbi:MAG: hypothetical protein EBU90_15940 [Proteobacteria bacterium]|nr:hypothetical protein [Pseudomonadota bacterium]NBP16369.1 hypothetical protein [bacterium]